MVTRAKDINTAYGYGRARDLDMALGSGPGQEITMALGCKQATYLSPLLMAFTSSNLPLSTGHELFCLSVPYPTIFSNTQEYAFISVGHGSFSEVITY